MSVVRIREGPYYRGFFEKKCMRILSVHGKLSVIERCPHGEVRLYMLLNITCFRSSSVPTTPEHQLLNHNKLSEKVL